MRWLRIVSLLAILAISGCKGKLMGGVDEIRRPVTVQYTEDELDFASEDGTKLKGTLMIPAGNLSQTYPGVLLISGSGPTDRDGNQPTLTPRTLKQIAVGLAGAGIASFRFDKRAVANYRAQWPSVKDFGPYFSWDHHLADTRAAYARMLKHGLIDRNHCAILGHSEGGLIALSIASQVRPQAVVLVACPGRNFRKLLEWQFETKGGPEAKVALKLAWDSYSTTGRLPQGTSESIAQIFNASVSEYMKEIVKVEPSKLISKLKIPTLIMNGDSDSQVDSALDAQILKKACGGRTDCELEILPLASHNLKAVNSKSDLGLVGPVVPDAIEALHKFLVPRIGGTIPENQLDVDVN